MASASSSSFERSLERFRTDLSKELEQKFNGASHDSLKAEIQKMQDKIGREKSLCNFRRLEKFLKAMKHVEQLVAIFLNVHEVVAFVWGPIKLALMIATASADSIRQLVDVYEEIGELLTSLAFFRSLIESTEHLRLVLEDYFSDILRFHRCVLSVFSRPNWKTFFTVAWGSFRRQIKPILQSLKRRQDMLSEDKLQSHAILEGVKDSRVYAERRFNELKEDLEKIKTSVESECLRSQESHDQNMKDLLENKLELSRFEHQRRLGSPELNSSSSGDWIFSHPIFQAWEGGSSSRPNVLFLNGSPGAGKTTLVKKLIRHLESKQPGTSGSIVHFFFRHGDSDRRSIEPMLRAILGQLIRQDKTILQYLYGKCASMITKPDLSSIKALAQDCLTYQVNASIILDGLDECDDQEPEAIIRWFLDQVLPSADSLGCRLRLLVSGQRDGRLDPLLSTHPQIRLDTLDSHMRDIGEYSKTKTAEIRVKFSLAPEDEEALADKVAKTSQGMFLYAKLVMENFLALDSLGEFEDEIESYNFPVNLDKAYERIVKRVLDRTGPSRQRSVKSILGWIICSKRSLRWREIQSRFCIDAEKGTCNHKYRRVDNCKTICGSLVDITECEMFEGVQSEQVVNMVHGTANKYLIQRGTIDLLQEHANMALFCCRYLSSSPFLDYLLEESANNLQEAIGSGYFGFLDYSTAHYFHHVQHVLDVSSASRAEALMSSTVRFLGAYSIEDAATVKEPSALTITGAICAKGTKEFVEARAAAIRAVIEPQHDAFSSDPGYLDLAGPKRFKCPRMHCSLFATGFRDKYTRDKHFDKHLRPFKCPHADCFAHAVGYESQERLKTHCNAVHQEDDANPAANFVLAKDTKAMDIFSASRTGNLKEVQRFHLAGVQLQQKVPKGKVTPLYLAAQAGHFHVFKYLVDRGCDPFESPNHSKMSSPMFEAIRQGHVAFVEFYVDSKTKLAPWTVSTELSACIAYAIAGRNSECLELLLDLQTPLERARSFSQVVTKLNKLEPFKPPLIRAWFQRVFPNSYQHGILAAGGGRSISRFDPEEYRICREGLFRPNTSGLLHEALQRYNFRHHQLVLGLLDLTEASDLQVRDREGCTPIYLSARGSRGCPSDCNLCVCIVKRIIQMDDSTSANIPDENGNLPLSAAKGLGRMPLGVIRTLISHTKNLNHRNSAGESVLHHVRGDTNAMRMFLETRQVDLFARNNQGRTAFSALASEFLAGEDVMRVLIEADPALAWTADENEEAGYPTPLHRAIDKENYFNISPYRSANQKEKIMLLLSLPEVENVLSGFLASPRSTPAAREEVREFAREEGLTAAIEVMERIAF